MCVRVSLCVGVGIYGCVCVHLYMCVFELMYIV